MGMLTLDSLDGNTAALDKYMDSMEKAEKRYEEFRAEVEANCIPQYNEMEA